MVVMTNNLWFTSTAELSHAEQRCSRRHNPSIKPLNQLLTHKSTVKIITSLWGLPHGSSDL